MAAWQVFTATLATLVVTAIAIMSLHHPHQDPDRLSVERIRDRISKEHNAMALVSTAPSSWSHLAPDHPLGVQEAHRTMQQHRRCPVAECARKAAAFRALIDAGRIKPTRMPPALQ
ncbi:hypothetical protein KHQ06_08650 [Nocardia tengchongensis]|uniref:DUF732 domain-containing protein n=1 Tax=Nocardia tengchongensis TaxID=2055889 RepID=A0ABX8CSX6_9NOCA|nr:hypothetical protein [Nocardia tengchongensis]QVI22993.1 hypothetical protein KHQ06_08650 [Nocardia tengchongensis]